MQPAEPVSTEELFQIAYVSESLLGNKLDENDRQLQEIIDQAQKWNGSRRITGALLFSGGFFGQIIEGPASEVIDLYGRIAEDPRHTNINQLSARPIERRDFADWSMALLNVWSEKIVGLSEIHASVDSLYATKHGIGLINLMEEWLTRKESSVSYFGKVI